MDYKPIPVRETGAIGQFPHDIRTSSSERTGRERRSCSLTPLLGLFGEISAELAPGSLDICW